MRRYNIYDLMNEYADDEFVPEKDISADIKDIRKRVEKHIKLPFGYNEYGKFF
ncbi:MAG: hypothetical protein NC394_00805 [Bacteroides sp.]|nr:hypothetical protein [Bacteroides sp.]